MSQRRGGLRSPLQPAQAGGSGAKPQGTPYHGGLEGCSGQGRGAKSSDLLETWGDALLLRACLGLSSTCAAKGGLNRWFLVSWGLVTTANPFLSGGPSGGRPAPAELGGQAVRAQSPALRGAGSAPTAPGAPRTPVRTPGPAAVSEPFPLASCDPLAWQRGTSSVPVANPLAVPSWSLPDALPVCLLTSQSRHPQHAEQFSRHSCSAVSLHLPFLLPELPFPTLSISTLAGWSRRPSGPSSGCGPLRKPS